MPEPQTTGTRVTTPTDVRRRGRHGRWLIAAFGVASTLACTAPATPPSTPRPDIVLVSIDTWRADRFDATVMPKLHALAARGRTFTNARSVAPLTLPAHVSLMTGTLPPVHGVRLNGTHRFDGRVPTLAELVATRGYRTAAFVGAYVLDRRFGLSRGFETYDDGIVRAVDASDRLEAERRATEVVDRALAWWTAAPREVGAPRFLWVHVYDPHAPYDAPAPFRARANQQPYDAEVAYVDHEIGRLLDVTSRDRALTVVVGDHGESLGEHGEPTHGMLLYDAALRVPLVIVGGGVAAGVDERLASLIDVMPTIAGLVGIDVPGTSSGQRLDQPAASALEVYAETEYPRLSGWSPSSALIDERWKTIDSTRPELFDLGRDRGETRDLAAEAASRVGAMRARLSTLRREVGASASATPSTEVVDRLRSLGYAAGGPLVPTSAGMPRAVDMMASWREYEDVASRSAAGPSRADLASLGRLAARHPESPLMQAALADALRRAGRARDAVSAYRRLVSRWPTEAGLFHDLAVAARDAGLRDEAIRAERASIALDGENALAHNGLGLLFIDAGRAAEARVAFERATTIDSTNPRYQVHLGHAAAAMGDRAAASAAYTRALDLDSRSVDALNGQGALLVRAGQPADALPWFRRALAIDESFVEARLNLGIACHETTDLPCAREAYQRVVRDAPRGSSHRQAAASLLASTR